MVTNDTLLDQSFSTAPVAAAAGDRRGDDGRLFRRHRSAAESEQGAAPSATPADVSSLLGMPLGDIPKPVLDKVAALVDEIDLLRTELSQAHHHVRWLGERSDQDSLLPVLHRRAFMRDLGRLMEQSERAGLPGALVLLQVGGVGLLRSAHGIEAGDAALTHVAGLLKAELRQTDLLGYLDNGDFAVALALTEGAGDKARDLAARLSAEPFEWRGERYSFTVLVGQAGFRSGETARSLLAAADRDRRG